MEPEYGGLPHIQELEEVLLEVQCLLFSDGGDILEVLQLHIFSGLPQSNFCKPIWDMNKPQPKFSEISPPDHTILKV